MIGSLKRMGLGLIAALTLATCAACSTFTSQTYDALTEECLTLDLIDDQALCLIGSYAIAVDELAEAREDGVLEPAVEDAIGQVINQVSPRVEAAAELWGAVVGYRAQIEAARDAVSEEDYLQLTMLLQEATAQAVSDWSTLRPQVMDLITLRDRALSD